MNSLRYRRVKMQTLTKKTKRLNDLKTGDSLKRKSNKEILTLDQIIINEVSPVIKKTYYYFPLCGVVRDLSLIHI